jgi:DNA-binding LacI/PurR family transcriptional regulator
MMAASRRVRIADVAAHAGVGVAARGVPHTVVDDVRGGTMATRHLLGLGHRRIGLIGVARSDGLRFCSTSDRLHGYRRAMTQAGHSLEPGLDPHSPSRPDPGPGCPYRGFWR